MENQIIGMVMLDKVNGHAVVIESVTYRDYGSVAKVRDSFQAFGKSKTITYYKPLSQLTTNPVLVAQRIG